MANTCRTSKLGMKIPPTLQNVQGREVIATLAHLLMTDDHTFVLLCAHLQVGLQLSLTEKKARKAQWEETDLKLTTRWEVHLTDQGGLRATGTFVQLGYVDS